MAVTWKALTVAPDQLTKQLTALTTARFIIFAVLQTGDRFTIVAYTEHG